MTSITVDKEELYRKIHLLPEDLTGTLSDFLDHLIESDEEPLTEEELVAIREAESDIAAGDFDTWDNVKRRLAELP